jgi:uncharacterized protein
MQPLNDEELQDLYEFFLSEELSDATMTLDVLDGYLTALVIGPEDVPFDEWLPLVWGPEPSDVPQFDIPTGGQWVVDLILRHRNGIVSHLIEDAAGFEPLFSFSKDEDGTEHAEGDLWAAGFMLGVGLREEAWLPLLETEQGREWLRPLRLLGSDELSEEDKKLVETEAQREELSAQIPERVLEMLNHFKPALSERYQLMAAMTVQRESPKVGRNDPCPCASGKKYKKCCGAEA